MKIDAENSRPKYAQLKDILTRYFREGHYQQGQQLPSENELMQKFDVSRSTVRQTLAELANEGVIYKKQGLGSFFSGNINEQESRSFLIGVMTPIQFDYIYPQILQGINDVVHQHDCNLILPSSVGNADDEMLHVERLISRKIDGLLFEPCGSPEDFEETKVFHVLKSAPIPVVFMDWALDDRNASYVSLDDVEGGFRATQYLIEAGHRRIAIVYLEHHTPSQKRLLGYRNALTQYAIPSHVRLEKHCSVVKWNEADYAYRLTKELMEMGDERPTAIFYFNDAAAISGYAAIRDAGLNVPDDISVMGFDDAQIASLVDVPLTSVVHPKYQVGKWAAEMLFDQMNHQGRNMPRQMVLHPNLAIRKSVKFLQ